MMIAELIVTLEVSLLVRVINVWDVAGLANVTGKDTVWPGGTKTFAGN